MLLTRRPATIAVLTVLVCTLTLLGEVSPDSRGAFAAASPKAARAVVGQPLVNAPMIPGSVFSFPNGRKRGQVAIRKRLLNTINSTWGGPRYPSGSAMPGNGTIRIATWTFDDWAIARALYRAHRRGVTVQIVAAKGPNKRYRPWKWLRKRLHGALYLAGHPETINRWSFARQCRGSCRGHGGTAHSKYLLFTNVGASHVPTITVQGSMNLTKMAFKGQWNQASTTWQRHVHTAFSRVFREARLDRPVAGPYRRYDSGGTESIFFPNPGTTVNYDPVMRALRSVRCTGTTSGGDAHHRTRIRIIQYAIYDTRGAWIAKRLRALWNAGCNVKMIYAVSSRPVLSLLRSSSGRGPVPMRQSVVRNGLGEIVKYNHSKWMVITGNWGPSTGARVVFPGSGNWANLAFSSDEQMQQIWGTHHASAHLAAFTKTWRQRTSRKPSFGRLASARTLAGAANQRLWGAPIPEEPVFGEGIYKHLPED